MGTEIKWAYVESNL